MCFQEESIIVLRFSRTVLIFSVMIKIISDSYYFTAVIWDDALNTILPPYFETVTSHSLICKDCSILFKLMICSKYCTSFASLAGKMSRTRVGN